MDDLSVLEENYKKYVNNLGKWLPEGIVDIDIHILKHFGLLNFFNKKSHTEEVLTRYFKVIESDEKITLLNEHFIIWIVPENSDNIPTTYTLIALNEEEPHLELVFATTGVYNTSRIVLRVLEKYLIEIQETEEMIKRFQKAS